MMASVVGGCQSSSLFSLGQREVAIWEGNAAAFVSRYSGKHRVCLSQQWIGPAQVDSDSLLRRENNGCIHNGLKTKDDTESHPSYLPRDRE